MTIGNRIKYLRKSKGMNQTDFATIIGKAQNTLTTIENDKNLPTTEIIIKICTTFNVSADWLIFGKEYKSDISDKRYEILDDRDKQQIEYILNQAQRRSKDYEKIGNL